jgi:hypothetical protein
MTYKLSRWQRKQTCDQWTECPRTGINDLQSCRGARESKVVISGQNVPAQESMTYILSRCQRKQSHDQWTECPRQESMTYTCRGARESKVVISGQNVPAQESMTYTLSRCQRKQSHDQWTECPRQESMTYKLSRCQRKQSHDQWTECPRTGINDLQPVEVPEKAKVVISGQNVPAQESMTYILSRCQRKQTRDQWTECPSTGINDLHAVEVPEKANS